MSEAGIDLIRLGIYLAKKKKFDWQELGDGDVKSAVRAAMDEKNAMPLKSFLEGLGVNWPNSTLTAVEAIEKTMKDRLATKKLRDLLQKRFGLKFSFSDATTIDRIRPMLSNSVLKELGIEPNEKENQ